MVENLILEAMHFSEPSLYDVLVFLCTMNSQHLFIVQIMGVALPYDNPNELRKRMTEVSPNLTRYGDVEEANYFKQSQELSKVCSSTIQFPNLLHTVKISQDHL
jgi:hypothetical protein